MIKNMGTMDRVLRVLVAAVLLYLALVSNVLAGGLWFWLALIVAGIFIVTAFVGNCPLYRLVGLKTCQDC